MKLNSATVLFEALSDKPGVMISSVVQNQVNHSVRIPMDKLFEKFYEIE